MPTDINTVPQGSFSYDAISKLLAKTVERDPPAGADYAHSAPSGFANRWNGMSKFINRPTTDGFIVQAKSEPTGAAQTHNGVESTVDWKVAASGGGIRALLGVARLKSTFTATGGTLIGTYGQVANDGTMNGAGIFMAALYGLVEDGGVFTAVNHIAAQWLDSHLTKTITAGKTSFSYITNNGSTTFDQVFYVYGGNKITNFLALDTVSTMLAAGSGTATGGIKILVDGAARYLMFTDTIS